MNLMIWKVRWNNMVLVVYLRVKHLLTIESATGSFLKFFFWFLLFDHFGGGLVSFT